MTVTTQPPESPAAPSHAGASYADSLALLSVQPSRKGRATLLEAMAGDAEQLARFHFGRTTRDNPHGDTLSWQETASILRQMAAAERGATLVVTLPLDEIADDEDIDDWTDWDVWAKVAVAATSGEYDTAINELLAVLAAAKAAPFTLRQVRGVALACSASRPQAITSYATEADAIAAWAAAHPCQRPRSRRRTAQPGS